MVRTTAVATMGDEPDVIQNASAAQKAMDIMTKGSLSNLTIKERADFLANMAMSLGLNPLTKPVDLIKNDKGELIVYYNRGTTDQLRAKHRVNLLVLEKYNPTPNTYAVLVRATLPNGRQDESTGVVVLAAGMEPAAQANAIMRAETKAKRRATLSILGLAMLDESEMDTLPLFQAQMNAPRTLAAPEQTGGLAVQRATPAEIVLPEGSQAAEEPLEEMARMAVPNPAPPKQAVPTYPQAVPNVPKTHTMPGRKLPVAPPVVIK